MSIDILRNKAAKEITINDFETAIEELKISNKIKLIGYDDIDGVLHINFEVTVQKGGHVTEKLRFGQFVSLIETGVSSEERKKMIAEEQKNRQKKNETAKKSAATRAAKKPENNIFKNNEKVLFSDMMQRLIEIHTDRSYDSRFIKDIANRDKLTSKQHNYLCKVAEKHGYLMPEKTLRSSKTSKKTESVRNCEHDDLGSLGYTHGTIVNCPFCGKKAEVW